MAQTTAGGFQPDGSGREPGAVCIDQEHDAD